ncbi:MAG: enolase C-terminal domain-like protein [Caldilineaceae bacterium]
MRRDTRQSGRSVGRCGWRRPEPTVKLKIGGRMSQNADACTGRTEALVALARKTFGADVAIYVDANSSYDGPTAIEVGRMLEAHSVGWLERTVSL